MLHTLRRLVSFADWTRNHPSDPPDGGDLDATFDALFNGLGDLEAKLLDIRRSDGALNPKLITPDALHPLLAEMVSLSVLEIVKNQLEETELARQEAVAAKILVEKLLEEVSGAAERALIAAERVDDAKTSAVLAAEGALSQAKALLQHTRDVRDAIPNPLDYAGDAQAWALASQEWAEHMPDVLPAGTIAWMGITGDHWSSRWWANHAAQLISDFETSLAARLPNATAQYQLLVSGASPYNWTVVDTLDCGVMT